MDLPPAPPGVEYVGPFGGEHYRFTVHGYQIPGLTGNIAAGEETVWNLFLDGRFGIACAQEELFRWLPFLAHAMAIAGGYSCFGEQSRPVNPYAVRMIGIEEASAGD
jgi:hypothetical protein